MRNVYDFIMKRKREAPEGVSVTENGGNVRGSMLDDLRPIFLVLLAKSDILSRLVVLKFLKSAAHAIPQLHHYVLSLRRMLVSLITHLRFSLRSPSSFS